MRPLVWDKFEKTPGMGENRGKTMNRHSKQPSAKQKPQEKLKSATP